jgi:hypothetical protein
MVLGLATAGNRVSAGVYIKWICCYLYYDIYQHHNILLPSILLNSHIIIISSVSLSPPYLYHHHYNHIISWSSLWSSSSPGDLQKALNKSAEERLDEERVRFELCWFCWLWLWWWLWWWLLLLLLLLDSMSLRSSSRYRIFIREDLCTGILNPIM